MKISIVGAGALGSYIGGRLAAHGEEVTLVARGEHLRAIRTDGLRIEGVHGNFHVKPVAATDNAGSIGIVDVVVLATKTYDAEGAAASLVPMLGEHSLVLPVLNGVEHIPMLRDLVGQNRLIGGVAYIFSSVKEPGLISEFAGINKIIIGDFSQQTAERTRLFSDVCIKAGFQIEYTDDIMRELWHKFVVICAVAGVTSLLGKPVGHIMQDSLSRKVITDCMTEALEVAKAHEVSVAGDIIEQHLAYLDSLPPDSTSSMQRDLEAGKRLEVHSLNGSVVRLGGRVGIKTPVNDVIYVALKQHAVPKEGMNPKKV